MTINSNQLERKLMKTIKLTDDQFETLFEFVDQKVESIVEKSIDYQDSEILEDWEDYFDEIVEEVKGGQFENDLH